MSKDIYTAIHELKYLFAEKGIEIELIKINAPLYNDGAQIETIDGVRVRPVVYEDEATHWRTSAPKEQQGEDK